MPDPIQSIEDDALFSYIVASADMRYIEVGERQIMLRNEPGIGPMMRGEMEGCGPDCEINLSEILLEYALTCEGCRDLETAGESAGLFGVRLGRVLAARLCQDSDRVETVKAGFRCILNSMQVPYTFEQSEDRLRFDLAYSPVHEAAQGMGSTRGIGSAQRALTNLCRTVLRIMAPNWTLVQPSKQDIGGFVRVIEIVRTENRLENGHD